MLKAISFFSVLLFFASVFLFVSSSVSAQTQGVSPTFGTINDCTVNGTCPTTGPATTGTVNNPTSGTTPMTTNTQPTAGGTTEVPTSTVKPCESETVSVQRKRKHHKKRDGGIGRFMKWLIEILKELLAKLGISWPEEGAETPNPEQPNEGAEPTEPAGGEPEPTVNPCEPTEAPEPTEPQQGGEEPTEGAQPTQGAGLSPTTAGGGQVETNATVKITFYGAWDNDPPGSKEIAYPVIHQEAGGTGTYEDPLTFASPAGDGAYEVGTKIYVPLVQKYFIKEDQCAVSWTAPEGCGAVTMVDLYVGNPSDAEAVVECENSLTPGGDTEIVVNPPAGLTVSAEKIWDQATGACMSPKN